MPKFYFSISNHGLLEDPEAIELPDLEAARRYAYAVAREIMRHREGMLGHAWREWTMTITDVKGEDVLSFAMSDAEEFRQESPRSADKSAPQSRG